MYFLAYRALPVTRPDRDCISGCRDISKYAQVMRVNAIGPMDVTQQMLPLLRKGKLQKIVNISSIIGSHTVLEQSLASDG